MGSVGDNGLVSSSCGDKGSAVYWDELYILRTVMYLQCLVLFYDSYFTAIISIQDICLLSNKSV